MQINKRIFYTYFKFNTNKCFNYVAKHPPIPVSQIGKRLKRIAGLHLFKEVNFALPSGICRGICLWFLYLYLNTKDLFSDPRVHMAALGEQLENGGGIEPTLLQSFYVGIDEFLNLAFGPEEEVDPTYIFSTSLLEYTPDQWRLNSSRVIRKLDTLLPNAYCIGTPQHCTAFVKIDDQFGYFFDPNHWIIEIQGNELPEKLYNQVSRALKETGDGKLIPGMMTPFRVSFAPVALYTQTT